MNNSTLKKVLNLIRRYRFALSASILLAIAAVVIQLYVPILFGEAIDFISGAGRVEMNSHFRFESSFLRVSVSCLALGYRSLR